MGVGDIVGFVILKQLSDLRELHKLLSSESKLARRLKPFVIFSSLEASSWLLVFALQQQIRSGNTGQLSVENQGAIMGLRVRIDESGSLEEIDALVERLREFVRLSYMTAAEVARRMGVRDSAVYSWLQGESRPMKPEVISAFLKSVPTENGSGIAPTGYEYREYKNWRGIPSLAVAHSAKRRRVRFEEGAVRFWECVQTAGPKDRTRRATMMPCMRGTGKELLHQEEENALKSI